MSKTSALQKVASLSQRIEKSETSLEQWKWQRAEAMAEAADAGATQREIAKAAGCSQDSARQHIRVGRERGTRSWSSFSEAYEAITGFDRDAAQARTDGARTKRILATAPLEQVEQIIDQLPPERQQAVAAAAGNAYHKARQEYDETERALTTAQLKEREATASTIEQHTNKLAGGFATLGIVGHIEQATEELHELNEGDGLSHELALQIDAALQALLTEFQVTRFKFELEVQA